MDKIKILLVITSFWTCGNEGKKDFKRIRIIAIITKRLNVLYPEIVSYLFVVGSWEAAANSTNPRNPCSLMLEINPYFLCGKMHKGRHFGSNDKEVVAASTLSHTSHLIVTANSCPSPNFRHSINHLPWKDKSLVYCQEYICSSFNWEHK